MTRINASEAGGGWSPIRVIREIRVQIVMVLRLREILRVLVSSGFARWATP